MNCQSGIVEFSDFQKVDIRVGVIAAVEDASKCRVPAYELTVDFGPGLGVKKSVAQITNYKPEQLIGKQVLAVVNFKPRQVGKHLSEVLILGVPTGDSGTALVVPDMTGVVGGRLY